MQKTWHEQWKTILGIVGLSLTALGYIFNLLDEQMAGVIGTALGAFTGVSLKIGNNRTERKVEQALDAAQRAVRLAAGQNVIPRS